MFLTVPVGPDVVVCYLPLFYALRSSLVVLLNSFV